MHLRQIITRHTKSNARATLEPADFTVLGEGAARPRKFWDKQQFPSFPSVTGGLLFAGVNGQPRRAANTYMHAVQPRFGFA